MNLICIFLRDAPILENSQNSIPRISEIICRYYNEMWSCLDKACFFSFRVSSLNVSCSSFKIKVVEERVCCTANHSIRMGMKWLFLPLHEALTFVMFANLKVRSICKFLSPKYVTFILATLLRFSFNILLEPVTLAAKLQYWKTRRIQSFEYPK